MNVLQNFVWGNKKQDKNLEVSSDFQDDITISNKEFSTMYNMPFYLSGDINNISDDTLYQFIKVQIGIPSFYDGSACASVYVNYNVWIFVESSSQKYKFFIGKRIGDFILKLPQSIKINRIYSVTGEHSSFIYGYGDGCMAPNSYLYYNIDALVSYELIQ